MPSLLQALEARERGADLSPAWQRSFKKTRRKPILSSAVIFPTTGLHCVYIGFDCTGSFLVSYSLGGPQDADDDIALRLQYWRIDPSGRKKLSLHFETILKHDFGSESEEMGRGEFAGITFVESPPNHLAMIACASMHYACTTNTFFVPRPAVVSMYRDVRVLHSWAMLYPDDEVMQACGQHPQHCRGPICRAILNDIDSRRSVHSLCNGQALLSLQDNWKDTVDIRIASTTLRNLPAELRFPAGPSRFWLEYANDGGDEQTADPRSGALPTACAVHDLLHVKVEVESLLLEEFSTNFSPGTPRVIRFETRVLGFIQEGCFILFQVACLLRTGAESYDVRTYYYAIDMEGNWEISRLGIKQEPGRRLGTGDEMALHDFCNAFPQIKNVSFTNSSLQKLSHHCTGPRETLLHLRHINSACIVGFAALGRTQEDL